MNFPTHPLNQLPASTQPTLNLIADFDQCFLAGFTNLEPSHQETLASVQRIFTGTPLQQPLDDACMAMQQNEFVDRHFAALAAVRGALQGSLFDRLQQHARSVLERTEAVEAVQETTIAEDNFSAFRTSIRHWLMEIALVGYGRLEPTTLLPFTATLEQIQAEPLLIRQAALLTGFFNELINQVPLADSNSVPLYRWVDLWTKAMVDALRPPVSSPPTPVSGTLELLGLDLHHHANLVSFTAYGVLTSDSKAQWVRITQSAYKVDAISGDEIWLLFPNAVPLLDALAKNQVLEIGDMPFLPTGDLLWQGEVKLGSKYNLMQKAAEYFAVNSNKIISPCSITPSDRHPIQLAEPIFLSDYKLDSNNNLTWQDAEVLPVPIERMSSMSQLTVDAIANSTELFGLLRFDAGRFSVQPLAITAKKKVIYTGQNAAKLMKNPPKSSTVSILQERASRLLRK